MGLNLYLGNTFIVTKNGMFVVKGYATEGLFKLTVTSVNYNNGAPSSAYIVDSHDMQHARLWHASCFSSIKNKMKIGLIPKHDFQSKACEVCVQSKYARKPFKNIERSSKNLGSINCHIWFK